MGKGDEKKKKVLYNFKIEQELKDKLTTIAKSKGLTLSGYIRMILIENVNKEK